MVLGTATDSLVVGRSTTLRRDYARALPAVRRCTCAGLVARTVLMLPVLALSVLMLAGCGQKGPLKLPKPDAAASAPASTAATAPN